MPIGAEFDGVLEAARAGAEWAWRSLYRDLAPSVVGYLRGRGATSPEDVAGDVFVQVVKNIGTFKGDEAAFRSWIFVIAHRRLLDEKRTERRHPEYAREPEEFRDIEAQFSTEDEALGRVRTVEVARLLDELTPPQREVILLRVLAGLSVEEVARVIAKRPRAVKSLQHRGLEALRRIMQAESS
jgi:RNA polymerase sigma-70 factor (ECF subfamily)